LRLLFSHQRRRQYEQVGSAPAGWAFEAFRLEAIAARGAVGILVVIVRRLGEDDLIGEVGAAMDMGLGSRH
jgi:hypothetical protein